jgi:hypothetical protein
MSTAGAKLESRLPGILWTAVSPRAAFMYLAAWMLVALVALLPTRSSPADSDAARYESAAL